MDLSSAATDLKQDEGCRLSAYPDPLSGGEPWTIGYGCTGPDIHEGTVWTQAQADAALLSRIAALTTELGHALPWFAALSEPRRSVLINMAYNLGLAGLLAFHATLSAMAQGKFEAAARMMLDSRWARQVPGRAARLALMMRTGARS